jgi:hypothetical protein
VVVAYQAWTYWVFRERVGGGAEGTHTALDLLPGDHGGRPRPEA